MLYEPRQLPGIYSQWPCNTLTGRQMSINQLKKMAEHVRDYLGDNWDYIKEVDNFNESSVASIRKRHKDPNIKARRFCNPSWDENDPKFVSGKKRVREDFDARPEFETFLKALKKLIKLAENEALLLNDPSLLDLPLRRCFSEAGWSIQVRTRLEAHLTSGASNSMWSLWQALTELHYKEEAGLLSVQTVFLVSKSKTAIRMSEAAISILDSVSPEYVGLNPHNIAGQSANFKDASSAEADKWIADNTSHLANIGAFEATREDVKQKFELLEWYHTAKPNQAADIAAADAAQKQLDEKLKTTREMAELVDMQILTLKLSAAIDAVKALDLLAPAKPTFTSSQMRSPDHIPTHFGSSPPVADIGSLGMGSSRIFSSMLPPTMQLTHRATTRSSATPPPVSSGTAQAEQEPGDMDFEFTQDDTTSVTPATASPGMPTSAAMSQSQESEAAEDSLNNEAERTSSDGSDSETPDAQQRETFQRSSSPADDSMEMI